MKLTEILRNIIGHGKKPKSPFKSDQEAYDFLQKVYEEKGGLSPDLRRVYEFYKKNYNDGCEPAVRP